MRRRDQRGAILPSPVVMLSIIAVTMAAVTFGASLPRGPKVGCADEDVAAVSGSSLPWVATKTSPARATAEMLKTISLVGSTTPCSVRARPVMTGPSL